ncbi:unnamed protein product [Adineta ricciae]|uniref:Uncharacterized protein n=1 Tax=Adineta ricciae TaxID=249248 RepID=A0A814T2Y7_ADIRI|nr:unnamed protein product [Adineta ricciae]CAF1538269.1 unnamed protein product [Adineta ricciae]
MAESPNPTCVALYDSSYAILFDDGSWLHQGLSNKLINTVRRKKSAIEFLTLGPDDQWFLRFSNGDVGYNVEYDGLEHELERSTSLPYKVWFNSNNGYVIQDDALKCSWESVPFDFHNKLNGRQKSLPKVSDIAFGPNDTWWVSFQDETARWSPDLPSYIVRQLNKTKYLVLDPMDHTNYFMVKDNGSFEWQVNDDFDNDMNNDDDEDDVIYMDPKDIRYTQTSISHRFSNGESIHDVRDDLNNRVLSVSDIPMINVVRTRSGNSWSLNNRRLWCFRHAQNIYRIPVRIVDERPSWFNERIQQLENPFQIHVRYSDNDSESDSDE